MTTDHGSSDEGRLAPIGAARPAVRTTLGPDYVGEPLAQLNRINFELTTIFSDAGFQPIEPAMLQSAELLFELYGEEIWDRAYMIEEAGGPAMCLRPDFTVPVLQAHLGLLDATDPTAPIAPPPARYGYFGPVFRRASDDGTGPRQHLQAGVEIIGEGDPAARDAEIFDLSCKALTWCGLDRFDIVTGDLNIMFSLLEALPMPESWRRRLKRHFWRPARFTELLRGFGGDVAPQTDKRLAFLKGIGGLDRTKASAAVAEIIAMSETPEIGVRATREVAERLLRQAADAREHPLPRETVDLIKAVLAVRGSSVEALAKLRELMRAAGVDLRPALEGMAARLDAMAARNIDIHTLPFDAAFGRNLEYYDGFVFEMYAYNVDAGVTQREKLGGGGRYDRLFEAMRAPRSTTGVGAALRPEAVLAALNRDGVDIGRVGGGFDPDSLGGMDPEMLDPERLEGASMELSQATADYIEPTSYDQTASRRTLDGPDPDDFDPDFADGYPNRGPRRFREEFEG